MALSADTVQTFLHLAALLSNPELNPELNEGPLLVKASKSEVRVHVETIMAQYICFQSRFHGSSMNCFFAIEYSVISASLRVFLGVSSFSSPFFFFFSSFPLPLPLPLPSLPLPFDLPGFDDCAVALALALALLFAFASAPGGALVVFAAAASSLWAWGLIGWVFALTRHPSMMFRGKWEHSGIVKGNSMG